MHDTQPRTSRTVLACLLVLAVAALSCCLAAPALAVSATTKLDAGEWHLLSIPVSPVNPSPPGVLPRLPLSLKLCRYDPEKQGYSFWINEENPSAFGGDLVAGEGYHLYVVASDDYWLTVEGTPQTQYCLGDVADRWHLIGLPRLGDFPLAWVHVIRSDGYGDPVETLTMRQALSEGWVGAPNGWNSVDGYYVVSLDAGEKWLRQFRGYWMNAPVGRLTLDFADVLTLTPQSPQQIDVKFPAISDSAAEVDVQRSLSPTSGFVTVATVSAYAEPGTGPSTIVYPDYGLLPHTSYYYRARARSPLGLSGWTSPKSATTQSSPHPIGTVRDVALDPDFPDSPYVYLATKEYGLLVVDFSDPIRPEVVGRQAPAGDGWRVTVTKDPADSSKAAFLGGLTSSVVVDVSTPSAPCVTTSFAYGARDVAGLGHYAYVAANARHSLNVLDLSNPRLVTEAASLTFGWDLFSLSVDGTNLCAAGGDHSVALYSLSSPGRPVLLGFDDGFGSWAVAYLAPYAYLDGGSIVIFDCQHPAVPVPVATYGQQRAPWALDVLSLAQPVPRRVLCASEKSTLGGPGQIRLLDVSQPELPTCVGVLGLSSSGGSMLTSHGTVLFVADNEFGLWVVDLAAPTYPRTVCRLTD